MAIIGRIWVATEEPTSILKLASLSLISPQPDWAEVPQMMRLNITTYNVLEMLENWEVARPYNFLLLPMVDPLFGQSFDRRVNQKVLRRW